MPASVMTGVDGSAESLAAAEWAAREALRRGLPLRLVHAWDWHPRRGEGESDSAAQRYLARRALRQAEDRVRAACPDVRLYDDQVEGAAIPALLKLAEGAELVVLGSRGLSGVAGFLVGSVAQGVAARSTGPVVLVRAGEEAADEQLPTAGDSAGTRTGYRDVVLALDLDAPCDAVIEFAFEAARLHGARLRVVHAWQTPTLGLGPGEIDLLNDPHRAEEWQVVLAGALRLWRDKYPGVEVVETVTKDRPQTALIRAASGASLLVVGRRIAERPVGRRIGPVTHAVIHHVDCPVAVVPHD
ncbi:universal stress protein [Streptomyces sp. MBT65]|uniref:universal stress protein n=1 Tax=Streptomyces sp. MBT65 TaxID=1488395 RepID=UPI00190DEBC6|nr:universal stress protein [Streptomyces sp. MBT65]MBK3576430.1 universal stress protein [Streptomyces sp. MBT65]